MGWSHLFCTTLSSDFSRQDDKRVYADCMLKCGFHKNTLGNCSCTLWGYDEKDIKCSCEKLCSQTWENLAVNIYSVNYSNRLWHKLHHGNWKHPWILKRKYTYTHTHTHKHTHVPLDVKYSREWGIFRPLFIGCYLLFTVNWNTCLFAVIFSISFLRMRFNFWPPQNSSPLRTSECNVIWK